MINLPVLTIARGLPSRAAGAIQTIPKQFFPLYRTADGQAVLSIVWHTKSPSVKRWWKVRQIGCIFDLHRRATHRMGPIATGPGRPVPAWPGPSISSSPPLRRMILDKGKFGIVAARYRGKCEHFDRNCRLTAIFDFETDIRPYIRPLFQRHNLRASFLANFQTLVSPGTPATAEDWKLIRCNFLCGLLPSLLAFARYSPQRSANLIVLCIFPNLARSSATATPVPHKRIGVLIVVTTKLL